MIIPSSMQLEQWTSLMVYVTHFMSYILRIRDAFYILRLYEINLHLSYSLYCMGHAIVSKKHTYTHFFQLMLNHFSINLTLLCEKNEIIIFLLLYILILQKRLIMVKWFCISWLAFAFREWFFTNPNSCLFEPPRCCISTTVYST